MDSRYVIPVGEPIRLVGVSWREGWAEEPSLVVAPFVRFCTAGWSAEELVENLLGEMALAVSVGRGVPCGLLASEERLFLERRWDVGQLAQWAEWSLRGVRRAGLDVSELTVVFGPSGEWSSRPGVL